MHCSVSRIQFCDSANSFLCVLNLGLTTVRIDKNPLQDLELGFGPKLHCCWKIL